MDPLLYGLAITVTVTIFVTVFGLTARRLVGLPVGPARATLAGLAAVAVSYAAPLDNPTYLPIQIGIALVAALLFLVTAEILVPTGSWPGPARWWGLLRRRVTRSRRYGEVVRIALRHGLITRPGRVGDDTESLTDRARSLRQALEEAGPTFIKLGQLAATRPDMLPDEFVTELSRLQDRVPPAPWEHVQRLLTDELGVPPDQIFFEIDPEPVAAASIAQVHRARLASGAEVVVKVQRPGISTVVERDLDILARLARVLRRRTGWARSIGIIDLADGFATALREELDFRIEADNMTAVRAEGGDDTDGGADADRAVRIPGIDIELSTRRVLVMQRFAGIPLTLAPAPISVEDTTYRRSLAHSLHSYLLRQVLSQGVFHADPHPGNVLLLDDGGLGLLDFGSVGRIDAAIRMALWQLLAAIDRGDPAAARDSLLELVDRPDDLDEQRLEQALGSYLMRHLASGAGRSTEIFTGLIRLADAHGLGLRPEVAAVFRAFGVLEGTLTQLSPGFDIIGESRAFARSRASDIFAAGAFVPALRSELAGALPLLRPLPRRIERITRSLEQGRLSVNVRLLADGRDRRFVTGLVHQVLLTVLAATTGIMAALLLGAHGGSATTGALTLREVFGYNLLAISAILGLRVLYTVIVHSSPAPRTGRRPDS